MFLAPITAAIGAPMIWIGMTQEFGAARGGAVNLGISAAGMTSYQLLRYGREQAVPLFISAVPAAAFLAANVVIFRWSSQQPIGDQRAVPRLVKASFGVFTVVLLIVGGLLVMQVPTIFP